MTKKKVPLFSAFSKQDVFKTELLLLFPNEFFFARIKDGKLLFVFLRLRTDAALSPYQSRKKGLSMEEKRVRLLELFHEKVSFRFICNDAIYTKSSFSPLSKSHSC